MTSNARLHLPPIFARRCLAAPSGRVLYCSRALHHTGRHAATEGPRRFVLAVWS
jgi:hypothetical protein